MCGILAILGSRLSDSALRELAVKLSRIQRHRGPDWTGVFVADGAALAHERLAIVDPESGEQPLYGREDDSLVLAVNGEIYNHRDLREAHKDYPFRTGSDCEVILPLYEKFGAKCAEHLSGDFAFVVYDKKTKKFMAARDPIGVDPLYIGYMRDGAIMIASEMKLLVGDCERIERFLPGMALTDADDKPWRWYDPTFYTFGPEKPLPTKPLDLMELREEFEAAVRRRMMSDVPWGVLLSGGLDSSLVSAIARRFARGRTEDGGKSEAWWPRLHSFSIGLNGSPDLAAAKKVADYLGTVHHGYEFTVQQGIDALSDVIYHLETFDVTTIRAATPMFLMSRKIKAMGVKMVLSGEGADEVFGGYLYFHKAPNAREFHQETCDKVKDLHNFDCLRANKSTAAFGVEVRVPFLDKQFLDYAMSLEPGAKMPSDARCTNPLTGRPVEKWALRAAFDVENEPGSPRAKRARTEYIPRDVLWRQKEQFSDGVGYLWIDSLRAHADKEISDQQFKARANRFPVNTPGTKEAYYYRQIFERHFAHRSAVDTVPCGPSVACSTAKAIEWDASFKKMALETNGECSGRAVAGVHEQAY